MKEWRRVQRFRCDECGKTFTGLPALLLPFKHYIAPEIEGVLRHVFGGGKLSEAPSGADESTLRRWWSEFSHKLPQWAGALESRVYEVFGRRTSFMGRSHTLERLEEALARLPALPSRWPVMVKTLYWLKTTHPLCLPRPP